MARFLSCICVMCMREGRWLVRWPFVSITPSTAKFTIPFIRHNRHHYHYAYFVWLPLSPLSIIYTIHTEERVSGFVGGCWDTPK